MCVLLDTGQCIESSGDLELEQAAVDLSWKNFTKDYNPQISRSQCDSWTLHWIVGNATESTHMNIMINISHL